MSIAAAAQNLVPNPSFEVFTACPTTLTQVPLASPWYDASGTPDFFHVCSNGQGGTTPSIVGVPENVFGHQPARTGGGYGGFYLFYTNPATSKKGREYIGTELLDTLKTGEQYRVEFYVVLADSNSLTVSSVGAHFSHSKIVNINAQYLTNTPQIQNSKSNRLTNKNTWTRVSGTFTAEGGERYMTIGNFNTDSLSDTATIPGHPRTAFHPHSYYFIDDISVTPLSSPSTGIAGAGRFGNVQVNPNPFRDKAVLQFNYPQNEPFTFSLYDFSGRQVRHISDIRTGSVEVERQGLASGLYIYRLQGAGNRIATGKLVLE